MFLTGMPPLLPFLSLTARGVDGRRDILERLVVETVVGVGVVFPVDATQLCGFLSQQLGAMCSPASSTQISPSSSPQNPGES